MIIGSTFWTLLAVLANAAGGVSAPDATPTSVADELTPLEVQQLMVRFYDCPRVERAAGLITTMVASGPDGDAASVYVVDYRSRRWRSHTEFQSNKPGRPRRVTGKAYIDGTYYHCKGPNAEECVWLKGFPAEDFDEKASAELSTYLHFNGYLAEHAGGAALELLPLDTENKDAAWKLQISPPGARAVIMFLNASGQIVGQLSNDPLAPIESRITAFQDIEGCSFPAELEMKWRGLPLRRGNVRNMTYEIRTEMTAADTAITVDGELK